VEEHQEEEEDEDEEEDRRRRGGGGGGGGGQEQYVPDLTKRDHIGGHEHRARRPKRLDGLLVVPLLSRLLCHQGGPIIHFFFLLTIEPRPTHMASINQPPPPIQSGSA